MPALPASRSTDSTKVRCSESIRNLIASPPAPQPKQKYTFRAVLTLNDGLFSSWKGHRPFRLPPPADLSVTVSLITSAMDVRSRTSAMSSSLTLATGTSCLAPSETRHEGTVPGDGAVVGERRDLVDHHTQAGRVVGRVLPQRREDRVQPLRRPRAQRLDQLDQNRALTLVPLLGRSGAHHVAQRHALEQRALDPHGTRDDQVGAVAADRLGAVPAVRGADRGGDEAAGQHAGHPLESDLAAVGGIVVRG